MILRCSGKSGGLTIEKNFTFPVQIQFYFLNMFLKTFYFFKKKPFIMFYNEYYIEKLFADNADNAFKNF